MSEHLLTEEEICTVMNRREGWTFSFVTKNANGQLNLAVFTYTPAEGELHGRYPVPSYCCEITQKGDFAFTYAPGWTIAILKTPYCGPFTNDDHFEKIQMAFEREAAILNRFRK